MWPVRLTDKKWRKDDSSCFNTRNWVISEWTSSAVSTLCLEKVSQSTRINVKRNWHILLIWVTRSFRVRHSARSVIHIQCNCRVLLILSVNSLIVLALQLVERYEHIVIILGFMCQAISLSRAIGTFRLFKCKTFYCASRLFERKSIDTICGSGWDHSSGGWYIIS